MAIAPDGIESLAIKKVAIVGAGPAGLMAASRLQAAGVAVEVFDAMPSVGRKFLLAGIGGLNLTHAEPFERFATRYRNASGTAQAHVGQWLAAFGPQAARDWAQGLGIETFVGTSQRVFPAEMKAAPLLRAWLHSMRHPVTGTPVRFHTRHRWQGWAEPPGEAGHCLRFSTPQGERMVRAAHVVLALGGASWPQLGSDGAWVPWLAERGLTTVALQSANCGFDADWSPHLQQRLADSSTGLAGAPLKHVRLLHVSPDGQRFEREGEAVLTTTGLEGSVVYAASAQLRDTIAAQGSAVLTLDLLPSFSQAQIAQRVAKPRGKQSLSSHLRRVLALDSAKLALLFEGTTKSQLVDADQLAAALKAVPIKLVAPRPVAEAISTAGGVALSQVDASGRVPSVPGLWLAGEMLDWEAPTGGYLLTACLASGWMAGEGLAQHLAAAGDAARER